MTGVTRTAACGLLGLALVVSAGSGALAQDEESFDQKIITNVLGTFGLKTNDPNIDYKERSPLVLPPRVELVPPEANPATAARNWPVDPDVKRRKTESRRAATGRNYEQESLPMRPNELNVGQAQRSRGPASPQSGHAGELESPDQLGYKGGVLGSIWGSNSSKETKFTQEPPRTSLTEPPPGYQTPSANQPYTAKQQSIIPVPSWMDFGTDQR